MDPGKEGSPGMVEGAWVFANLGYHCHHSSSDLCVEDKSAAVVLEVSAAFCAADLAH